MAGPAAAIELVEPIACPDGATCYIQSLVDRDIGAGARDFTCGSLSYDGHQGTDFRVSTMAELRRGVPILAAAPGVVRATRDGERDEGVPGMTKGRDCGNGIVIDHGGGWTTQYCHLALGGVEVSQGEQVGAGQRIGRMGFSGNTEFPHLHITLRQNGVVVDPFDGRISRASCAEPDTDDLWVETPELRPGGLVDEGFTGAPPTLDAVRAGDGLRAFGDDAEAIVIWSRGFGLRLGDIYTLTLFGPDDAVLATSEKEFDRNRAEEMRFVGKRRPQAGWASGRYRAEITLERDGEVIEERRIQTVLD